MMKIMGFMALQCANYQLLPKPLIPNTKLYAGFYMSLFEVFVLRLPSNASFLWIATHSVSLPLAMVIRGQEYTRMLQSHISYDMLRFSIPISESILFGLSYGLITGLTLVALLGKRPSAMRLSS
jgi:hypothetical protein